MSIHPSRKFALRDLEPAPAQMRADVLRGLRREPRMLPSQYLYDERGAELFEEICATEEYYLTRTEIGILRQHMPEIAATVGPRALVIEPGSGSGIKTRLLLGGLAQPAGYVSIDIAKAQLAAVADELHREFPGLSVLPVCADFTQPLELPGVAGVVRRRVVYFPGSTIGNFEPPAAARLLARMRDLAGPGGGVLLGVDLRNDPAIIEPAYDDSAGVSGRFALNYLERLNRELAADFDADQFIYEAPYNTGLHRVEMRLTSLCDQEVRVAGMTFQLRAREHVYTEFAYKYDLESFAALAAEAGLRVARVWTDRQRRFSVQYLVTA